MSRLRFGCDRITYKNDDSEMTPFECHNKANTRQMNIQKSETYQLTWRPQEST